MNNRFGYGMEVKNYFSTSCQ